MSRLDMILVSSGKAAMCTETEIDWNLIDSDHSGVKIWLYVLEALLTKGSRSNTPTVGFF